VVSGAEFGGELFEAVGAAGDENEICTPPGEPAGEFDTEARARAGDEDGGSGYVEGHVCS
jgi:hypothetical protein